MKSSKILREDRNLVLANMDALVNTAETENRQFTDAENIQYKEWRTSAENILGQIDIQADIEKRKAEKATAEFNLSTQTRNKAGEKGEKSQIQAGYSMQKAIRSRLHGGKLNGLELEMNQEAEKEVRAIGKELQGVGVPNFLIRAYKAGDEQRATAVTTSAANAGNLVGTTLQNNVIPVLRPRLLVQQLGAQVITGLTGNLDIPKDNALFDATWETEIAENTETDLTIAKISASPNRLGAKSLYSRSQLFQSSPDLEMMIRNKLNSSIERKLDATCINGSGSGAIPQGILNFAALQNVAIGTNGGALTRAHILELEELIATANADQGTQNYLSTYKVRRHLKETTLDAGSGRFLLDNNSSELNSYGTGFTNQVPGNLVKGSSGSVCQAMIFGDFSKLKVYQWAGVDLIVDEITLASQATIKVIANSYWDIKADYENAFAAIKDIIV